MVFPEWQMKISIALSMRMCDTMFTGIYIKVCSMITVESTQKYLFRFSAGMLGNEQLNQTQTQHEEANGRKQINIWKHWAIVSSFPCNSDFRKWNSCRHSVKWILRDPDRFLYCQQAIQNPGYFYWIIWWWQVFISNRPNWSVGSKI